MKVENGRIVEATRVSFATTGSQKGLMIFTRSQSTLKDAGMRVKVIDMTYGELIRGSRTNEELAEIYCYELGYKDDCPPDFVEVDCNIDNQVLIAGSDTSIRR